MLTQRKRLLLVPLLAAGVATAGLVLALSALPAAAQPVPAARLAALPLGADQPLRAGRFITALTHLYLPVVENRIVPCSVAPQLVSPANKAVLNTLIPDMTYFRKTEAVSLSHLVVAANPFFISPEEDTASSGGDSGPIVVQRFDNLSSGTTYYWRAQDRCGAVDGPFSAVYTFTTGSNGVILPAPNLLTPADGALNTGGSVTFTWQVVVGASNYQFRIQSPNGTTNLYYANTAQIYFGNLLAGATYTWYVTAANSYAYGAQSLHRHLNTGVLQAAAPTAPTAPAPPTGWPDHWLSDARRGLAP